MMPIMKVDLKRLAAGMVFLFIAFAVPLFGAAGTLAWPAGWVYLALFFGFVMVITAWLYRYNPGLLNERTAGTYQAGQKGWDKALMTLISILFVVWLVLMPLDAVRWGWSQMPTGFQVAGTALLLCSFYLFYRTFRENSFLSPAVRIQKERGQTVISTGPYHYVRHPIYAAALLFLVGTPLLLGSWYGVLLALVLVGLMAQRAVMEERTLREELPGYDAYMAQVKYRLIPYVW
jgi:protein-S-isoprenylcysteine O-methyltransferase Ste14